MRSSLLTVTALFGLLLATGCPTEAPDPGDPAPDWGFVSATLAANCNPCHTSSPGFPGSDPMMDLGDADLAYDLLVDHPAAETSGAMNRVEPGDSENSYVIHKLRGTHVDAGGSGSRMPEGGPFLDDDTIDAIAEWIDAGASEEITSGDDDDATGDDDDATGDDDDATGDDDDATGDDDDATGDDDDSAGDDDDSAGDDDDSAGDDDDSTSAPTFSEVYSTILSMRCSCHNGSSHSTGFFMNADETTAYNNLVNVDSFENAGMDRIEPGDADGSYLVNKIQGTAASVGGSNGSQMPLSGGPLSQADIDLVRDWVDGGAVQ